MEKIKINTAYIQLDQFLKWAGVLPSGGEIRFFLAAHKIWVNHMPCQVKRKKLYPNDIVTITDVGEWQLVGEES